MPAATSERFCHEGGCVGEHYAKGLCARHYQRARYRSRTIVAPPKVVTACSVDDCGDAAKIRGKCNRHYQADWRSQKLTPLTRAFPPDGHSHAAPVRAHLQELAAAGITTATAAALARVPAATAAAVVGGTKYVRRDQALALMRIHVDPSSAEDRAMISAHGAQRRVQALVALGWTFGDIASWLDCHQSMLSNLIHPATHVVSGRQHRQIDQMYRQRMMTVPAVKHVKALARAAREGWAPPLAWDDIDRDVRPPAVRAPKRSEALFDETAVELALDGQKVRLRRADKIEVVTRAHARRWSDQTIARVTGIIDRTVFRIRQDLGLPGWELHELAGAERGR